MDPAVQVGEALKCQLAEEVLCLAGELRLRVTGTSMMPSVWPGDILHIRREDATAALPGDIVLVHRQGRLCAHRVVKKISKEGEPYWITRGDSLPDDDPPVSRRELLGRVTCILRGRSRLTRIDASRGIGWWARLVGPVLRHSEWPRSLLLRLHTLRSGEFTSPCGGSGL